MYIFMFFFNVREASYFQVPQRDHQWQELEAAARKAPRWLFFGLSSVHRKQAASWSMMVAVVGDPRMHPSTFVWGKDYDGFFISKKQVYPTKDGAFWPRDWNHRHGECASHEG